LSIARQSSIRAVWSFEAAANLVRVDRRSPCGPHRRREQPRRRRPAKVTQHQRPQRRETLVRRHQKPLLYGQQIPSPERKTSLSAGRGNSLSAGCKNPSPACGRGAGERRCANAVNNALAIHDVAPPVLRPSSLVVANALGFPCERLIVYEKCSTKPTVPSARAPRRRSWASDQVYRAARAHRNCPRFRPARSVLRQVAACASISGW